MVQVKPIKDHSQNGEFPLIFSIFKTLGIERGHAVDIGAGNGWTMSNVRNLIELGWSADMYDGDPKGAKDVKQAWITADSDFAGMITRRPDFINLDIDGVDYYVLDELLRLEMPSLIVCEVNPIFERNDAKVMPYDAAHVWKSDTYYGMSLAACEKLAATYGYTLMHLHAGINAFLLRNDHAKAHPELIRPIEYRIKHDHARHNPALPWITLP
jgi:hypothetical protein